MAHSSRWVGRAQGSARIRSAELHSYPFQSIYAKGVVCIALRTLWNEEIFVDHALNPYSRRSLPAWYRPLDEAASRRVWKGIAAR